MKFYVLHYSKGEERKKELLLREPRLKDATWVTDYDREEFICDFFQVMILDHNFPFFVEIWSQFQHFFCQFWFRFPISSLLFYTFQLRLDLNKFKIILKPSITAFNLLWAQNRALFHKRNIEKNNFRNVTIQALLNLRVVR